MKVLIVTGGRGEEREISLISANNVAKALKRQNHSVRLFDLANGLELLERSWKTADTIFPVIHGPEGEDGTLQEFLEKINARFVGSGSKACKDGWDKFNFKIFSDKHSIKTPAWFKVNSKNHKKIHLKKLPLVIKPSNNGSSIDVLILRERVNLTTRELNKLLEKYNELLVEDYIDGIEVTVGVLGNNPLPVVEIQPPEGEWFSYENKYTGRTKEIAPAPSLTKKQIRELEDTTLKIHQRLGCRHFSRTDFIVGKDENIYALEINMIPGLTTQSLLPKAAQAAGITFEDMVDQLVHMSLAEWEN